MFIKRESQLGFDALFHRYQVLAVHSGNIHYNLILDTLDESVCPY